MVPLSPPAIVQSRRHRDLPDHGVAVHRRRIGDSSIGCRTSRPAVVHDRRVHAGVSGAGLATLAGGLQTQARTARRVGSHRGIDRFMSEARAPTNFSGNAVAALVVGAWTKTVDNDKVSRVLSGEDPFDEMTMLDEGGSNTKRGASSVLTS